MIKVDNHCAIVVHVAIEEDNRMSILTKKVGTGAVSLVTAMMLSIALCPMLAYAASETQLTASNIKETASIQTSADAGLTVQSTKSSYWVKTKDYRFKIPKYWRGKVQWKTTSYKYQNKWGNWDRQYKTSIYLKGHKGDERYLIASVYGGVLTGFGSGYDPVITKKMKLQDNQYFTNIVVLLSKNIPYFIYHAQDDDSYYSDYLPVKVKDQKKLLKLATFNKVTYAKAKRSADYGTSAYKTVKKYQKKYFKSTLKVLR